MQVGVVMPVYNAEGYVSQAVQSALEQPETAEVILVEDGSPDNGLERCRELAAEHGKVRLLQHPGGRNRGAGASRNLAMRESSCEYIAFLDADDFYLPGRFSAAKAILETNPDCGGVYEAVGHHVQGEAGLRRWTEAGKAFGHLTTVTRSVNPEDLWDALVGGTCGYFHLDGFVLKRSALERAGNMAEGLRLHQDTEFMLRVALTSRLLPGSIDKPVAMVRVHESNRISTPRSPEQKYRDRMLMWMELYRWCKRRRLGAAQQKIMDAMIEATISIGRMGDGAKGAWSRRTRRLQQLLAWLAGHPGLVIDSQLWRSVGNVGRPRGVPVEGEPGI